MINIILVDDHELILGCLEDKLSSIESFNIVKSFTNPKEVVEFLKENDCDILISDLMMKGYSGIDLVKDINKEIDKDIKIILLSGFYDRELHRYALELGVKAFIKKESSYDELVSTIYNVNQNNRVIPEEIVDKYIEPVLSDIELKVIKLVVQEYKNEEIAKELFLSKRTIENHISSICNKLNVNSRIGAVREAIKLGMV